jgi:hypothetical protein
MEQIFQHIELRARVLFNRPSLQPGEERLAGRWIRVQVLDDVLPAVVWRVIAPLGNVTANRLAQGIVMCLFLIREINRDSLDPILGQNCPPGDGEGSS